MTKYCLQAKLLSISAWDYLSKVFSYGLPVSEIGITNHLIFDLVDFYASKPNIEVYALHAKYEKVRGADIDLFIEDTNGKYCHFMIQAKVMDFRGKYNDISKYGGNAQYTKLCRAANVQNAIALYILYNGKTINSKKGKAKNGLSLIKADDIRIFRLNQKQNGYKRGENILHFDLLFPFMIPYSYLFCDDLNCNGTHTLKEIYTGYPYRRTMQTENSSLDDEVGSEKEPEISKKAKELAAYRIIMKRSKDDSKN